MRALREQPRLVAAKLSISLAALIVALVVGSALAGDGSDTPADLRPALERSERLRRDQSGELRQLAGRVARLRADLRTTTRRARARARARERLGRELREARRSLARERQP
jgi:septal ring factor EnvC (AmiA/AmiB activator)